MKLWEVIKALTEDPTKRFETKLASKGWTACMRVDTGFSKYFKFEVFNGKRLVDQSRDDGAFNDNIKLDLDWYEPMTAEEEKILREIAAWFPSWQTLRLEKDGDICIFADYGYCNCYFGFAEDGSKAYEVLAPILEKHGEIDLDDYRDTEAEKEEDEQPFGSCDFCGFIIDR